MKLSALETKILREALREAIESVEIRIRSEHVVNPTFATPEDKRAEARLYRKLGRFQGMLDTMRQQ